VKFKLLQSQFAAEMAEGTEWEPRYNIPPTPSILTVRAPITLKIGRLGVI